MNRRLFTLLVAAPVALLAGACASAPIENIPLLVSTDLDLRLAEASAPTMASSALPAPLESTKWSRSRDPELEPLAALGGYIGGSINSFDPEGVMDGTVSIVGANDTIALPDVDLDPGFSVALGYRGYKYALEFSYERTDHDGDYGPVDEDTVFHVYSADVKRFYWPEARLQPYYTVGLAYLVTDLDNASFDNGAPPSTFGDATLTGVAVNAGVGLNYLITSRLSFDARAVYRFGEYLDAEGVLSGQEKISGDADASSYGLIIGLQYIVKSDD